MSTQFEFRLIDAGVPEGQMAADDLLTIIASLKEISLRIGRAETAAEPVGRAPKRVHQVADLLIGLAPGSTRLLFRRADGDVDALDSDLPDEQAVDERFESLLDGIANDRRPDWVDDSLAQVAWELAGALHRAAPEVEFVVDGQMRRAFSTASCRRETWTRPADPPVPQTITFVGRLFAVNLKTHRLQVQDDVGHQVALPKVLEEAGLGALLGKYVLVTGRPGNDSSGSLAYIHDAKVEPTPDPLGGASPPRVMSLEEILASAPGPPPSGGLGLTEEESDAFLEAMGF